VEGDLSPRGVERFASLPHFTPLFPQTRDGPGASSLPWVRKTPALPRADPEEPFRDGLSPARVECDARTTCPRDTTCCFMKSSGLWGCCPLPKVRDWEGLENTGGLTWGPHPSAPSRQQRLFRTWVGQRGYWWAELQPFSKTRSRWSHCGRTGQSS
jgi:hypothetical protein